MDSAKKAYIHTQQNVEELTGKVNSYVEKFDRLKSDMEENTKKFTSYQTDIETKKLEIQSLQTEIENTKNEIEKEKKVEIEYTEDKKKTLHQIEVLKNLNEALMKKAALDKENLGSNS